MFYLYTAVYIHHMHAWCLLSSEESTGHLKVELQLLHATMYERNETQVLRKKSCILLTTKPSLCLASFPFMVTGL